MSLAGRFSIFMVLASLALTSACATARAPTATAIPVTETSAPTATLATPTDTPTALPTSSPTAIPTAAPTATRVPRASPTALQGDPLNGARLFAKLPCSSCHDITHPYPGGQICPNLGNIASEAARIVKSPDYHGQATDAAGYIRESILNPNAYIVPGESYHMDDGQSLMPKDFRQILTPSEIDDLVAFLMQHK